MKKTITNIINLSATSSRLDGASILKNNISINNSTVFSQPNNEIAKGETVNLNKKVYVKNQYEKVIDTKFSQLASTPTIINTSFPEDLVGKFFQDYENLFYIIPKTGATNSHEYLIKTSTEYINYTPINNDIQALIDEINLLQQQNLELNQQLIELQTSGSNINGQNN